jgi:hypothetical protein
VRVIAAAERDVQRARNAKRSPSAWTARGAACGQPGKGAVSIVSSQHLNDQRSAIRMSIILYGQSLMLSENRSTQVNLRLQPALKAAAEKAAAQDHRSLTSLIEKLLADYLQTQPTLEDWHERALARFTSVASDRGFNYQQFGTLARSYSVRNAAGEQINPAALIRVLGEIHVELRNPIAAFHIFYPYRNRPEIIPYYIYDNTLSRGKTDEILEMSAFPPALRSAEFWRVSPSGLATDVSTHLEDNEQVDHRQNGLHPGKWFCPFYVTRQLAPLVLHASQLSQRFPSAETVEFHCEWSGLLEREISDPDRMGYQSGKIARADQRVTLGEWPVAELSRSWPDIVSKLGSPVLRLFDPEYDYSTSVITNEHLRRLQR